MPTHFSHATDDTDTTPGNLDDALARIDARARRAHDAFERARDFATALEGVRGRGESSGVRVVVDHHGLLREVAYPDPLPASTPSSLLAQATVRAHRAALADALAQLAGHARTTWGDDPLATQVVDEARARFVGAGS